jgi:hypothetical protein
VGTTDQDLTLQDMGILNNNREKKRFGGGGHLARHS